MGTRILLRFKDNVTNVDIPYNDISNSSVGFSKTMSSSEYALVLMYANHQQASIDLTIKNYNIETVKLLGGYEYLGDYTQTAINKGIVINIDGNKINFSGSTSSWKDLGDTASNDNVSQFRVVFNTGGYSGATRVGVEKNLYKCSTDVEGSLSEGEHTITLIADENYYFGGNIPYIKMGYDKYNFILNEDKTVATIDIEVTDNIKIYGFAKWLQKVVITGVFENCYCNYSDGEVYDKNKKITIYADDGYIFKEKYEYSVSGYIGDFKNERTKLVIDVIMYDDDNIKLYDEYRATIKTISLGGFINLYLTDDDELRKLSNARFLNSEREIFDYGSFIYNLYILPFELPNSLVGSNTNIILGSYDSKIISTEIKSYEYDVDFGTINIPLKYNNMYDFLNVDCYLHLPYTNKVWLNSEYIVGQQVNIIGTIDLYNNSMTYNVYSSFNDEIILSMVVDIGKKIPFIQRNSSSINNLVTTINNNIDRCFIEVNRNIPYTKSSNVFGGAVVEYGRIGDYEGYLECDSIVLETKATNQEQEEIKNLLRNGVFI